MGILKHIAFAMDGIEEDIKKSIAPINEAMRLQIEENIPIITFFMVNEEMMKDDRFFALVDPLADFFRRLSEDKELHRNKIKISALGKWYELPERLLNAVKDIVTSTKDYDGFFVNFCINYNGREEIADACRIIARMVKVDKLDPETINKENIKENIYSSGFLPPDIIVVSSARKKTNGFLLWDSADSELVFTGKKWKDIERLDLIGIIEFFKSDR